MSQQNENDSVNPSYSFSQAGEYPVKELAQQILKGDRLALARGITIVENDHPSFAEKRNELLETCLPHSGNSLRIGITGVPGAGKSTFIEALGKMLIEKNKKVAVLAIDPSSTISKGSILGDKTRMAGLSVSPRAFIRPSASGETLGGIAAKTKEALVLCEAAGFDIIIVETVGVGQSETMVRSITDLFLLLAIPGAGDELQGIKRGIMEMADIIAINKTDGDNLNKARLAKSQLSAAMHLFPIGDHGWVPRILNCSALENSGIEEVWKVMEEFHQHALTSGTFIKRRNDQEIQWFHKLLQERWKAYFVRQLDQNLLHQAQENILKHHKTVYSQVEIVFNALLKKPLF